MKRLFVGIVALLGISVFSMAASQITGYVQINPPISPQPGGFNTSSGTVGIFTDTGLSQGGCVQSTVGTGLLTTTGVNCGTGGGGVGGSGTINTAAQYSAPYYALTSSIVLSGLLPGTSGQVLTTAGSSTFPYWSSVLTASSATVTYAPISGSTNYIQNSSVLQSGATFYVSSGTIAGPNASLNINTLGSTNASETFSQNGFSFDLGTRSTGFEFDDITGSNSPIVYTTAVGGNLSLNVPVTVSNLTPGRCVQTAIGGLLTVASDACNSGSGSMSGTIVASPQYEVPFYSGSGSTTTLTGTSFITSQVGTGVEISTNLGVGISPTPAQMIKVDNPGTSGDSFGINGTADGVGGANHYGLYGWGSGGATNNYGLYIGSGNVRLAGIASSVLAVDSNGIIISTTVSGGGSGNGTVVASPQFQIPYYSLSGTTTTVTGLSGVTTHGTNDLTVSTITASSVTVNGQLNAITEQLSGSVFPTYNALNINQVFNGNDEADISFSDTSGGTAGKIRQLFYSNALPTTFATPLVLTNQSAGFYLNANGPISAGGASIISTFTVVGNSSIGSTPTAPPVDGLYVEGEALFNSSVNVQGSGNGSIVLSGTGNSSVAGTISGTSYNVVWDSVTPSSVGQCAVFSSTNGTVIGGSCGTGGSYINNQSTLQFGSTFYTSDGNIAGPFVATGTVTLGSAGFATTVSSNAYLGTLGGLVGINTNTPSTQLQVNGGAVFAISSNETPDNSSIVTIDGNLTIRSGSLFIFRPSTNDYDWETRVTGSGGGSLFQFESAAGSNPINMTLSTNGNVGIGTGGVAATSGLQVGSSTGESVTYGISVGSLTVITSTKSIYEAEFSTTSTSYQVAITTGGHISSSFAVGPSTSSCGTGAGFIGTDVNGTVTPGSTASGCTITFSQPYKNTPSCIVTERSMSLINALSYTVTTTALTVSQTSLTSVFDYICYGLKE